MSEVSATPRTQINEKVLGGIREDGVAFQELKSTGKYFKII